MASDNRNQNQKAEMKKMPPGTATNLHKNMATGMGREAAEDKALTDTQSEKKPR